MVNKSVSIVLTIPVTDELLKSWVQKSAHNLKLQGTGHAIDPTTIRIIIQGPSDAIDEFIDLMYGGYKHQVPEKIEVEPYGKVHDFRGVFRLIE